MYMEPGGWFDTLANRVWKAYLIPARGFDKIIKSY